MSFSHLHVHTEHSPFDGIIRVSEMFDVVKANGQDAVAITDHGTLAAMWSAQNAADRAGVKLIPGIETYVANGSRFEKNPFVVPREDASTSESADTESGEEDEVAGTRETPYQHLTLIAASEAGWRNLVLLNNHAQDSIWSKPRIDYKLLADHAEGIIVLTGCMGGPVLGPLAQAVTFSDQAEEIESLSFDKLAAELTAQAASEEDEERESVLRLDAASARAKHARSVELRQLAHTRRQDARANLERLIECVGRENVYVEVMDHGIDSESRALPDLVALAAEFDLPLVASNDCHYTHAHQHDRGDHLAWLNVPQAKKGATIDNPGYVFPGHGGYHLRTEDEMRAVRSEQWWQDAVSNTSLVADRVPRRVLPGHRDLLPKFDTPEGFSDNREYMFHLLREGAARIYGGISKDVHDRIKTEMEVIEESGYIDYFLVVHELVSWCRDNGILTGPGRGSAAGSLATYLLGITRVDPLRYSLLFERFLERGRVEPPDIDIDFPQQRRGEVIQHLRDRWGEEKVAYIGTFQMARSKAAVKDAARVLGLPPTLGNKLSALVPEDGGMTLADIYAEPLPQSGEQYRKLVEADPDAKRIHEIASSFEGITRGVSVHASGIIVSATPLIDTVPMRKASGDWVLQWTGPEAEAVGLLKVDVLGLRNLDVVAQAVEYIEQTTGERIDPLALPDPDDPDPKDALRVANAYRVIGAGRTAGLFQLESPKMTELAMDVSPNSLDDLSALVALFRPGPMGEGLHTEYAARKKDPSRISYRDYTTIPAEQEQLATVLDETLGIVVMQEQLMRIGTVVAGFNAGERSQLRKAVSKKKADVMAIVKEKFLAGAPVEHRDEAGNVISIPFQEQTAIALWNSMVSFASYAFNKSHSAAYGYLAYTTAYLKANWPAEYAAATLAATDKPDKRLQVLRALDAEGVTVLPPDVNLSGAKTQPEPGRGRTIRIGLGEIRGVGSAGALIVAQRESGPYRSATEVFESVIDEASGTRALNATIMRALIESGACDSFGARYGQMLTIGVADDRHSRPVPDIEWGTLERAARQRRSLQIPIGEHPITALKPIIDRHAPAPVHAGFQGRTMRYADDVPDTDGERGYFVGVLASWAERSYSRGRMANIILEGADGSISGTMWDTELNALHEAETVPTVGDVVIVYGRVRYRMIDAHPDDPESESHAVKELTISQAWSLPIPDEPIGSWDPAPFERIDFVPEVTAAEVAPPPMLEMDLPPEPEMLDVF